MQLAVETAVLLVDKAGDSLKAEEKAIWQRCKIVTAALHDATEGDR